jgi:hypothetical protein
MTVDTATRPVLYQVDERNGNLVHVNFRTINRGTFEGDLPRGRKATGRKWEFVGIIDMVVERGSGLVLRLDEWYTNNGFDHLEGGLEGYHSLDGTEGQGK